MNHDSGDPPRAALKDYLAALQISYAAVDDNINSTGEQVSSGSSETRKLPFILVDDNMKATPSFLLASTTPPKCRDRHRPLNRSNSLPIVSTKRPQRKSSSSATTSRRILNAEQQVLAKKKSTKTEMSQSSSSLVHLLHLSRTSSKEKQDQLDDDDDDHHDASKLWCRWDHFTSGHRHSSFVDKHSKNDTTMPTVGKSRRKSHDQGISLPTRTIEEEDASI